MRRIKTEKIKSVPKKLHRHHLRWLVIPALLLIAILILPRDKPECSEEYQRDVTVRIDGSKAKFNAEAAITEPERQRGLSGKRCISRNTALLFQFQDSGYYGIWMKAMHFSIDIVWLDENKVVTHIEKNVSPDTFPHIFTPAKSSHYVLEFHEGVADSEGIKVGTRLNW
jgi:uncharacterized membrane protein (UPF0127 family)